ncbi:hypothetical protein NN561_014751 [Cricetulus griseus]
MQQGKATPLHPIRGPPHLDSPGTEERGRPKLQQLHPLCPPPPAVMLPCPATGDRGLRRVSPRASNKHRDGGGEGRWKSPSESTGAREGGEVPTLCSPRQCGLHTTRAFFRPYAPSLG